MTVFMPIPIPMPAFALGLGYMFYGVSGAAKVNCASLRHCITFTWIPCFWVPSFQVPHIVLSTLTLHPCVSVGAACHP